MALPRDHARTPILKKPERNKAGSAPHRSLSCERRQSGCSSFRLQQPSRPPHSKSVAFRPTKQASALSWLSITRARQAVAICTEAFQTAVISPTGATVVLKRPLLSKPNPRKLLRMSRSSRTGKPPAGSRLAACSNWARQRTFAWALIGTDGSIGTGTPWLGVQNRSAYASGAISGDKRLVEADVFRSA